MNPGYNGAVFQTFLLPVTTALTVFPLVVLIVMLPVAVVSYRRRGRAGGWTTLAFYGFLFYLLAAALQTVVPLPSDPAGYCAAQNYASTPQLRPFYFVQVLQERARGDWSPGSGYELAQCLVARHEISAVFVGNDQMALGVLRRLHEAGRRVPFDISVVGFDDIPEAQYYTPPLTTVRQDFGEIGRRSMQLMLEMMDSGDEGPPSPPMVGPELIVRSSTAPA